MPNNQNRSNQDFSKFDSMTNEELEEILRLDAQKTEGEESDLEMLLYVMEVLTVRKKNSEPPGKTAREAFETFKEYYMPDDSTADTAQVPSKAQVINMKPTKRLRPWLSRLVATAAILALVFVSSITAHAMGIDIWEIIVTWTQETFYLKDSDQSETPAPNEKDIREYTSLQAVLDQYCIATQLTPTWFPDGYELVDVKVEETPMYTSFLAVYQYDQQKIKIQIKEFLESDPEQIEQSDTVIDEYASNGTSYYIFADNKQLRAVWIKDCYECYISGQLDIDTIKMMIDSIY